MPSSEYHLKQAQVAARLALVESNPEKAKALHLLAMEHYEKAEKADEQAVPAYQLPTSGPDQGMETG